MSQHGKTNSGSLSTENAIDKLIDAAKVIERRMGVKATEEKRVKEAFMLLATEVPIRSRGTKQQVVYLDFLKRVREVAGPSAVVLCAAGLGPSAIANMKDRIRVDLPFTLRERQDAVTNDVLQNLADCYTRTLLQPHHDPATGPSSNEVFDTESHTQQIESQMESEVETDDQAPIYLTGDVYELNVDDIRAVAMSQQIPGKILLTDSYNVNATSFITIPVSVELTNRLIRQRPRLM